MRKKNKAELKHLPYRDFKAYLAQNGIKQNDVAKLLGVQPQTLSRKINGYLHFSYPEVEKICDEYGLSADFFRSKSYAKATNL
jgi:transcriptional regulator with XRE-family HTH domain